MAYIRIWIHCVWGTKNRIAFLTNENKKTIIDHIRENAKTKGIYIDFINGSKEHLHCIISLDQDQNISKVMQLIKGESSFWINKNKIMNNKFEWADEYFAVSISESHINKVREYIKKQEEHHRAKTWEEEYNDFIIRYGFQKLKD
jgi:REP element-mobilizing transposase RayT